MDFGPNFKFAKTFCIGKRSREMMFGVVFRVIGSNVEEMSVLVIFDKKAWTIPLGFWSKFQIC